MTNRDRILELLRTAERPLTDSEIRRRTGIEPHQQVNQICRKLAAAGLIDRRQGAERRLVNSVVGTTGFEETADEAGRSDTSAHGKLPELQLEGALVVIPCSGRKRRGGTKGMDRTRVVEWLPEELAMELLAARQRNARSSQLDESRTMPAIERYTGMLYEAAGGALERIHEAGAEVVIADDGSLPADWTSSDGVPLRVEAMALPHEETGGTAHRVRIHQESGVEPLDDAEPSPRAGVRARMVTALAGTLRRIANWIE